MKEKVQEANWWQSYLDSFADIWLSLQAQQELEQLFQNIQRKQLDGLSSKPFNHFKLGDCFVFYSIREGRPILSRLFLSEPRFIDERFFVGRIQLSSFSRNRYLQDICYWMMVEKNSDILRSFSYSPTTSSKKEAIRLFLEKHLAKKIEKLAANHYKEFAFLKPIDDDCSVVGFRGFADGASFFDFLEGKTCLQLYDDSRLKDALAWESCLTRTGGNFRLKKDELLSGIKPDWLYFDESFERIVRLLKEI